MQTIVLASSNKGKIKEFTEIFATINIKVVPQTEYDVSDADETGLSFIENAIIKARNCAKHTNLPSIADDSGLEVDALNGAPGIYSARYSGMHGDDTKNIDKVLSEMLNIKNRSARFHCVIAYVRHELDPSPMIFVGTLEGVVLEEIVGSNGFGYDPIFRPISCSESLAMMSKVDKNKISHRSLAINKLVDEFKKTEIIVIK